MKKKNECSDSAVALIANHSQPANQMIPLV